METCEGNAHKNSVRWTKLVGYGRKIGSPAVKKDRLVIAQAR